MGTEDLSRRVLDTLVNAPSSVAGIYADLVYLAGYDGERVLVPLRSTLDALEQRGWVLARVAPPEVEGGLTLASHSEKDRCWDGYAAWLPRAARDDLAADEIGLWYGITESGRDAWRASADDGKAELWQLDDDSVKQTISIVAGSKEAAERRLTEWLLSRRGVAVSSKEVSRVAGVKLRSGQTLVSGVRLTCGYARTGT
jgi:hypothetical protein